MKLPRFLAALTLLTLLTGTLSGADAAEVRDCAVMESYWWGVTVHKLSEDDRELIERVVMAESGGTGLEGMCGVAQVIRERAESWGMSAREVVTARGQFTKPYCGEVSGEVKTAVAMVFDEGYRQFAGYTTHFHADHVKPRWTKNKVLRGTLENQLFWGVDAA